MCLQYNIRNRDFITGINTKWAEDFSENFDSDEKTKSIVEKKVKTTSKKSIKGATTSSKK